MTSQSPVLVGIASGRPGAGRTTVGLNVAASLAALGHRVGFTDTEVLGPVAPESLGAGEPLWSNGRLVPRERFGVQVASFAYLVQEIERGGGRHPSLDELAARFQTSVAWDAPVVLFIELPSCGDATRALIHRLRLDGVLIVATPRAAEEGATEHVVAFFRDLGIPLFGIIENLSYYECRQCGRRDAVEASGAVQALARRMDVRCLGEVPISIGLRDCMDERCPAVACASGLPESDMFRQVALRLMAEVEQCGKT